MPIGLKPVFIGPAVQRVLCRACDALKQVKIGFADRRRGYTRQLERYALELSRPMTIQDVAGHLKVSWDVSKDIRISSRSRALWGDAGPGCYPRR